MPGSCNGIRANLFLRDFGRYPNDLLEPLYDRLQARARHWLEQVRDRIGFKRRQGIFVVRRDENDQWQCLRLQGSNDFESIEARHLYVEEYDIGAVPSKGFERRDTVVCIGFDNDAGMRCEQFAQARARS